MVMQFQQHSARLANKNIFFLPSFFEDRTAQHEHMFVLIRNNYEQFMKMQTFGNMNIFLKTIADFRNPN